MFAETLAPQPTAAASNVVVSTPIALGPKQEVGLVTRYSGPLEGNFYVGRLTAAGSHFKATIWKNTGGKYRKLVTGLTTSTGTGNLSFQTSGSTLTLSLDATVLAVATDTSFGRDLAPSP